MRNFFNDLLQQIQDPDFSASTLPLFAVAVVFFFGTALVVYKLLMAIRGPQEEAEAQAETETQQIEFGPTGWQRLQNIFKKVFSRKRKLPAKVEIIPAPEQDPVAVEELPEPLSEIAPKEMKIELPTEVETPVVPEHVIEEVIAIVAPSSVDNTVAELREEMDQLKRERENSLKEGTSLRETIYLLETRLKEEKGKSGVLLQEKLKIMDRAEVLERHLKEVISEVERIHAENQQIVTYLPLAEEFEELLRSAESVRNNAVPTKTGVPTVDPIIEAQASEISKLKDLLILCKRQIIELSNRKAA
jgi:hypothetical protein